MAKFQQNQGSMANLMKQAQKMQENMAKMQNEILEMEFEGTAGGGAVTCMMLGDRTVKSFAIDPDLLNPEEADMLSDLLAAACNEATRKLNETTEQKMSSVTGGMKLPGM
ncbi:MAG: YbaB/EbfC family nucleoid-associated protein [Anaerofustis sp.]